jgi:hypothetical protein
VQLYTRNVRLIGLHRPYAADPSYQYNNPSHDSDTEWHSITVPQAGTVALEQLDGPSAIESQTTSMTSTTTQPPPTTQPPCGTPRNPSDLITTADGKCTYKYPNGMACVTKIAKMSNRNKARHWFTCHAMKELLRVRRKKLDMSQATIINSTTRKMVAETYLAICPLETCVNKGKPKVEFVRDDSLIRHMTSPNKHKGLKVSKREAHRWANENLEILQAPDDFSNAYEEAVWRIWHGY